MGRKQHFFKTGRYQTTYSNYGIERIERIGEVNEEQDEQDAARLRQVLENLKKQKINDKKTFYSQECVICMSKKPDILFCSCGHVCLCSNCDDLNENSNKCPVCKTESDIKRKI